MTSSVAIISPDRTLKEAAGKMEAFDVGDLLVCEGQRLVGVLTDRDITIRATAEGLDPERAHVADVMTPDVVFCAEDQDVKEAAKVMEEVQVRRLPVLDREMHLTGIVSLGDLAVRTGNKKLAGEVLERVSEPGQATTGALASR
jgi:CBS domain-containing protein